MFSNWKFNCALVGLLLAVTFVSQRAWRSFHVAAPAGFRLENRQGPALPAAVLSGLQALLHQLDLEIKQSGEPVESLAFFVIHKGGKQLLECKLETIRNPGFAPASEFPVPHWTTDQSIVGYYLLDGTPLTVTLKHHPSQPKTTFLVVETREPLAPGAAVSVLHVEQQPLDLHPDSAGLCRHNLPRVPRDEGAIHAVAICLPAQATLQKYQPAEGAYLSTKDAPLVAWINRRLDDHAPAPFVVFKLN